MAQRREAATKERTINHGVALSRTEERGREDASGGADVSQMRAGENQAFERRLSPSLFLESALICG